MTDLQPYQREILERLGQAHALSAELWVSLGLPARRYARSQAMRIYEAELQRQGWTPDRRDGFTLWTRPASYATYTEAL